MTQTILVILLIAAAALYVAWRFRPSRLKSENPCDSCSGCSLGREGGTRERPESPEGPGECCGQTRDPNLCQHSDKRK